MPLIFGHPSDPTLTRLAREAASAELSYSEIGITRRTANATDTLRFDHWAIDLDDDASSFERACRALRAWHAHRGAGVRIVPYDAPIEVGQTLVVAFELGAFTAVAPCRIVWVDEESDRFGFAYGTLHGHPERGEESFVVHRKSTGVTFEIVAASQPATLLPRMGAPVARSIQKRVTNRYLTSLKRAASFQAASGV